MNEIYAIEEKTLREYLFKIHSMTDVQTTHARSLEISTPQLVKEEGDYLRIDIKGILLEAPSYFAAFFGYNQTTYEQLLEAIEQASQSDKQNVMLAIDSPGGYVVKGLDDSWKAVRKLSESKNVVAVNMGLMASAAYWIASGASRIVSASPLTEQGSIGVYASFYDWSEYDKKEGIREVIVVSKNAPLKKLATDDDRLVKQIQERLNNAEKVFLSSIAEGCGLEVDYIAKNFGQGAILSNEKAEKAKMIDGVVDSLDKVFSADTTVSAQDKPIEIRGDHVPSLKELLAENPEARAEYDKAIQTARDDEKAAIRADLKEVLPFVSNANYSEQVRNLAALVVDGKATNDALKHVVEYEDRLNAAAELAKTQAETADLPETPAIKPNVQSGKVEGLISTEEEYKAEIERLRNR